jgi:hypothetical protein
LPRHYDHPRNANARLERVALVKADTRGLASFDAATKSGDKRHAWFVDSYGTTCWELDAMSPNVLRKRVRHAIRQRLDMDAWRLAVHIERAQVESLKAFHKSWQASKYSACGA